MKELGIKTSLNPDAHAKDHINYMQYGIKFLRKALLNKEDVLNTLSLKEFNKMI